MQPKTTQLTTTADALKAETTNRRRMDDQKDIRASRARQRSGQMVSTKNLLNDVLKFFSICRYSLSDVIISIFFIATTSGLDVSIFQSPCRDWMQDFWKRILNDGNRSPSGRLLISTIT